jgi:hypothetical protein
VVSALRVHLGQIMSNLHGDSFPTEIRSMFESLSLFIVPADKGFPLKEGFELYIGAVDEKPNSNQQFRFTIALDEPGIIEGKPLIETIHQLTTLVEGIVATLSSRLR